MLTSAEKMAAREAQTENVSQNKTQAEENVSRNALASSSGGIALPTHRPAASAVRLTFKSRQEIAGTLIMRSTNNCLLLSAVIALGLASNLRAQDADHLESIQRRLAQLQADVDAMTQGQDRKSTRLNSSHTDISRMPSSA